MAVERVGRGDKGPQHSDCNWDTRGTEVSTRGENHDKAQGMMKRRRNIAAVETAATQWKEEQMVDDCHTRTSVRRQFH